jgi:phosphatidyl-myo-inositol dimannoside synthase
VTIVQKPHITVSAQFLEPGQGGIGRTARLSVRSLADTAEVRALAVEDRDSYDIGGVRSTAFHGSRWRFALANEWDVIRGRPILYDFPGTARAHIAGRWLRNPYAVWIHGYEIWAQLRPDYIAIAKAADLALVNSHYSLERIEASIGPMPRARVCWLGTEQDESPPPQAASDGPPTLLFVGRSDELFGKGQDLLVEAWPDVVAKIPDARLVLVGGGDTLWRLQELVRNSAAHGNIDVLGFVPDDDMAAVWRRATACAMLGCYEGFGLVFIEAMRHGLPVIASTDDASCEVNVNGVTGFNVSRSDRAGLTERILFLLSDRDRAAQYGRAGFLRWQEHFRFSAFKTRFAAIMRPWLQGPRGGSVGCDGIEQRRAQT